VKPHIDPGITFTENKGQWDSKILMRAGLDGGALFLEKDKLTFNFYDKQKARKFHGISAIKNRPADEIIKGHAFHILFEGSNPSTSIEKYQEGNFYENFFIGNDKTKWQNSVKNFHQIWYRNLYNNIDYELIASINGIKYNFHVKPGADAQSIKLKYDGVDNVKIKDGKLIIKPQINEIIEQRPYAYQIINDKVSKVECNFILKHNTVTYEFPNGYDKRFTLVIDPVLVFAAQSGSTADNFGMTATFDPQGNLYSGGTVFNVGYPTTTGAYSSSFFGPAYYGNTDIVITKYNSSGNNLLYSTYLGGNYTEAINSMIVDNNNNLCFYGVTSSTNFPMNSNSYDNSFNGGSFIMFVYNGMRFVNGTDIYIGKFNSTGTSLLASTYIGGSANDGLNHTDQYSQSFLVPATPPATGNITVYQPDYDSLMSNYGDQCRGEIQVDALNNIYVSSSTRSSDFPTVNSFDNTLGGLQDGVFIKFDSNLSTLLNSSFVGGSSTDAGYGLIVESNTEVYMTGGTSSQNFPYSAGGYQTTYQGGNADGYVIRISSSGNSVLNGTYFGTSSYDQSFFIQSDKQKNIYIYGQSLGNIPVVIAATSSTIFNVPNTHQFISRFNSTLNSLNMSTVFGNYTSDWDISPAAFSVDKCNNIYLSGWGANFLYTGPTLSNMPLMAATQSTTDGHDFYFMGLDSNCAVLKYGSYFGGNLSEEHVDGGTSRFDPKGKIYQSVCAGCGGNDDFPVTPGAWPCITPTSCPPGPNLNSNCNNGVIKLDFQLQLAISTINTNTLSGCAPLTITFTNATPGSSYTWYLGNGITTSVVPNPTATYTAPGNYTVSLVVIDPATCNKKDSAVNYITVLPSPNTTFSLNVAPCTNSVSAINTSTGNFGSNPYSWNWGDGSALNTSTNPSHTYTNNGVFTVSLTATDINGCSITSTNTVGILNFIPGVNSATICSGQNASITASGGTTYTWSTGSGAGGISVSPTTTTIYTVNINNTGPGYSCNQTLTTQVVVYPKPNAAFNASLNPCGGGVYFTDISTANISAWQWTLSSIATSTTQNPYYFYSSGGTQTITLVSTNTDGCKDTTTQIINVPVPPAVSINGNTLICRGKSAQLSASGGSSYQWTPTVSLDISNISTPIATPSVSTQYSVVITSTNGCTFLLTTDVAVFQQSSVPVNAIATPPYVVTGNSTTLTYIGSPGAFVTWYPLGSTSPTTGYTVSAAPDKPTTYTAVATNGPCADKATVFVEAYTEGCIEKDVFIPNTFTPNSDGNNDYFIVRGLKVQEIYFAVYNRWGEMVFETTDKTQGWDGLYKGRPADVGVFGWYLKVKCFNGEETFRKGNVTLVR